MKKTARYLKRFLKVCAWLSLLIILLTVAARSWVHSESGQRFAKRQFSSGDLEFKSLQMPSLLPNRLQINGVRLSAQISGTTSELTAEHVGLQISLTQLLRGKLVFRVSSRQMLCSMGPSQGAAQNLEQATPISRPQLGKLPVREVHLAELHVLDLQIAREGEIRQAQLHGSAHLKLAEPQLSATLALNPVTTPSYSQLPPLTALAEIDLHQARLEAHFDPIWLLNESSQSSTPLPLSAQALATTANLRAFLLGTEKGLELDISAQWLGNYRPGTRVFKVVELDKCLPLKLKARGQVLSKRFTDFAFERLQVQSIAGTAVGSGKLSDGVWRDCMLEMEVSRAIQLPKPLSSIPKSKGVLRWSGAFGAPSFSYTLLPGGRSPKDWMSQWKLQVDRFQKDPTKWVFDLLKEDAPSAPENTSAAKAAESTATAAASAATALPPVNLRRVVAGNFALDEVGDSWRVHLEAQGILPECTLIENTSFGGFFSWSSQLDIPFFGGGDERASVDLQCQIANYNSKAIEAQNASLDVAGKIPLAFFSSSDPATLLANSDSQWSFSALQLKLPNQLQARDLLATTEQKDEVARFSLAAKSLELATYGNCPLKNLELEGDWQQKKNAAWFCALQKLEAQVGQQVLRAESPLHLIGQVGGIELPDLHLQVGKGGIWGKLKLDERGAEIDLKGRELPLALLKPLIGSEVNGAIGGSFRGSASSEKLDLQVRARTKNADLTFRGAREPVEVGLSLDLRDTDMRARLSSSFLDQPLCIDGHLPLKMSSKAPFFEVLNEQPLQLSLAMEGEIAPLAALVLPSGQVAASKTGVDLKLEGTLQKPTWTGRVHLQDGEYIHEASQTHLVDIKGDISLSEQLFSWNDITGRDEGGGEFKSKGKGHLWPAFALQTTADLQGMRCTFADFARGQVSGQLQWISDVNKQYINGNVQLVQAKLEIPDEVSTSQPLAVRKGRKTSDPKESGQPTDFDIEVDIPAKVLIVGRGLNSHWRGAMHLGGTSRAPILQGVLQLDSGNFTFCGRQFKIVDSSIHLRGDRQNEATLHLVGEYPVEGATVRAILQGPLRSPKLSFESYPQLSLNEMISRVLFGTSFNTISPFEALQVGHAALFVSSGKSPVPIEQLRRNIQLDQISFQMPQEEEDQKKYVLQVGKYLRDGVLVGVKQSIGSARESDVLVGTQVTLELKIKQYLTLKTEVGYLSESTVSLLWKKDY